MPHHFLGVVLFTNILYMITNYVATVVGTFALACSLPEGRKVLCRLQINLADQNNVYFGTSSQTLQTKNGGKLPYLVLKLIFEIVSLPR